MSNVRKIVEQAILANESTKEPQSCHAGQDGDCNWSKCPQLRDNEPHTTGRHCPIDDGERHWVPDAKEKP